MTGRKTRKLWGLSLVLILGLLIGGCSRTPPAKDTSPPPSDPSSQAPVSKPPPDPGVLDRVKDNGLLRVGVGIYMPQSGMTTGGEWIGLDSAIYSEICKDLGCTTLPSILGWTGIAPALSNDVIDAFIGLYKTAEREEVMTYSDVVYYVVISVAARTDSGITQLSDIAGKTMGVVRGTGEEQALQKLTEEYPVTVRTFEQPDAMFMDLLAGRVHGVVWPRFLVEYAKATNPDYNAIEVVTDIPPKYFGSDTYQGVYYTFKKGSESDELVAAVNKVIQRIKSDGTLARIMREYGMDPDVMITGGR